MREALATTIIAVILSACARGQAREERIAFVGCPSDGQAGPIDAPQGMPKVVTLDEVPAEEVAYYKGEQAPGVFAPRGWHCRVWYGSSGSTFVVIPASLESRDFPIPNTFDASGSFPTYNADACSMSTGSGLEIFIPSTRSRLKNASSYLCAGFQ